MFLLPSVIANTIAATRIYRSLVDYSFESSSMYYYILRSLSYPTLIIVGGSFCSSLDPSSKSNSRVSKIKWSNPPPISLNRIEVAVDTAFDRYPTSRTTIDVVAQQGDKPHELSVGSDLEYAMETSSDLQIPAATATVGHGLRGRGHTQVLLPGTAV
jgi:hypothetical protein